MWVQSAWFLNKKNTDYDRITLSMFYAYPPPHQIFSTCLFLWPSQVSPILPGEHPCYMVEMAYGYMEVLVFLEAG